MVQETINQEPKLSGYRVHAKGPEQGQRGICTFVRRGVNSLEHDCKGDPKLEKQTVEIIVGKESIFLTNVYSNPKQNRQSFKHLFHENLRWAGESTLVVAGDFNAPHTYWGHKAVTVKGRNLLQDATEADLQLITDPRQPTLMGRKSTDRDTTPDLVFTNEGETTWTNTKEDLGSDHFIVEIQIPLKGKARTPRKLTFTDWEVFREAAPKGEITDIEAWTKKLQRAATAATREIETTEDTDGKMDSSLAHLIEAKQSITNRWRQQRLNRRLRKKIAELNKKIQEHCTKLSSQQWDDMCHKADKQMHNGATWRLLRHLIDETKTKGYQHNRMAGIVQTAIRELGEEETKKKLRKKYLPETEKVVHGDYTGTENERQDRDLEPWEVRNALQRVNGKSAAGKDKVNNKTLRNLSDEAGSVISPLLFNLVMTKIARRLETQSVRHTIYADDITLWSVRDEEQQAQDELQEAVLSIEEELEGTGLACSPSKSELLVINPKKKTWDQLTVQTGTGQVIPRVKKIRILGLIVDETRKNMETVHKLEHKTNAAIQLVKRVANRKGGMRENSLMRMVQSFVISHLAYIAAFHNWKYNEKKRLNCMIRKAYKKALGLYASTNTEKMESLGVHNRLEEVIVAQRTAQVARLEKTRTGRETLRKLKIEAQTGPEDRQVDSTAMGRLDIRPIPRHMHPVHDEGRRKARAQALTREHGEDSGTVHVDAARHGDHFVAAVVRAKDGGLVTAASIRTQEVRVAEEVAIALAASLPTVKVVLSDSMRALRNFMAGRISQAAARTLDNKSCGKVTLKWYPAHEEGNAVADAMARALGDRAGSQSSHYEPPKANGTRSFPVAILLDIVLVPVNVNELNIGSDAVRRDTPFPSVIGGIAPTLDDSKHLIFEPGISRKQTIWQVLP
ncbi:hypothetical protein HPB47_020125 [Ixodes persulcatus]|uniref:Uncharacterized protein n=1 Tax=Ixodes persulcatus TaxID=34615 RepID=A0AC60QGB6_IXOPE|nr:hypothetical protein HPB47_020125 [Ixodes persulcatus]